MLNCAGGTFTFIAPLQATPVLVCRRRLASCRTKPDKTFSDIPTGKRKVVGYPPLSGGDMDTIKRKTTLVFNLNIYKEGKGHERL
jgi:hypothetical protein